MVAAVVARTITSGTAAAAGRHVTLLTRRYHCAALTYCGYSAHFNKYPYNASRRHRAAELGGVAPRALRGVADEQQAGLISDEAEPGVEPRADEPRAEPALPGRVGVRVSVRWHGVAGE